MEGDFALEKDRVRIETGQVASMDWFQRQCLALEAPDFVLHIGAGSGKELEVYQHYRDARIVLVEPQAERAAVLTETTAGWPNITVIQRAITDSDNDGLLYRFSLPDLDAPRRPTGLLSLYPGLIEIGATAVDTVSMADLLSGLDLDPDAENWLVLDVPYCDPEFTHWCNGDGESDRSLLFSHIFLRSVTEPLYEGVETLEAALKRLRAAGFETIGSQDLSDPDVPGHHLQATAESVSRAQLNEKLRASEEKVARLEAMQALREADLRELQERYAAAVELRNRQHDLLVSLRQRLALAADYLRRLDAEEGEGSQGLLTGDLIRALTGDDGLTILDASSD